MRGALTLLATFAVAFLLTLWPNTAILSQDVQQPTDCPYVPAYGTIYDMSGDDVVPNDDNRSDLLAQVLDCAERHLSPTETARYQASVGAVISGLSDPNERAESLLLRTELAAAISSNAVVREQDEVARRLFGKVDDQQVKSLAEQGGVFSTLTDNGWTGFYVSSVSPDRTDDYVNECRAAGVPVPPPISSGNGWVAGPPLTWSRKDWLLHSSDPAVWTYTDGSGFCVALRRGLGSSLMMGTICSDYDQRHACFFDSLTYRNGKVVQLTEKEAMDADFASLAHPEDIKNRCNGCHVGENPFIVNPHSQLGQVVKGLYAAKPSRFEFVGAAAAGWENPDPIKLDPHSPEGACVGCHDLPGADTGSYCSRVLQRAAGLFMPPTWASSMSGPNGSGKPVSLWPGSDGCPTETVPAELQDYILSVHRLRQMCRPNDPVPDCPTLKTSASSTTP